MITHLYSILASRAPRCESLPLRGSLVVPLITELSKSVVAAKGGALMAPSSGTALLPESG